MPLSPFRRYSNSQLLLQIYNGRIKEDKETGNLIPVPETLELSALLNASKSKEDTKQRTLPAADLNEIYVTGYLVAPMQWPEGVKLPIECDAVIGGQKGRLKLELRLASSWGEERKTGAKISGYFRVIS